MESKENRISSGMSGGTWGMCSGRNESSKEDNSFFLINGIGFVISKIPG
jgi:hypothetical protein